MEKWYNNSIYNTEREQALIELKKRMNQIYPEYSFSDNYIVNTFNDYLDISLKLGKSFTGTDPKEWKVILSDIWVLAIYMVINNFPADTTPEKVRATLKENTGPWDRDQIVYTLNAIMSFKDDPVYGKYYAPYAFKGAPIKSAIPDNVSISTATKQVTTETAGKFPIMYIAIGGAALLGLFLFMKKKK